MSWVKLSDDWFEEPHVEDIGADAAMLHLSALAYSARHSTDGVVPRRALRRLYPIDDADTMITTLVDAKLWEPTSAGYLLNDWSEHILSADEVTRIREQNRIRQDRLRRHNNGDHSLCSSCWYVRNRASHAVTDGVTEGVGVGVSSTPRPDSTRLDSTRSDSGGESRAGEGRQASCASAPHARLPRTTAGRLRKLDAAMLDELPWRDLGTGCPHDATGWAWVDKTETRSEGVRCDKCMELVRNTNTSVGWLARTDLAGFAASEDGGHAAWFASFEHDAALTSAALCIASLICTHVDGEQTAERVDAVATEIVRRHPSEPMYAIRDIIERKTQ